MRAGARSLPAWLLAGAALCYTFCCFTFANWIASYWTEVTEWGPGGVGTWIAVLFLIEMVYTWIVGAVLDRIRNRKLVGVVGLIIYGGLGIIAFTASSIPVIYLFTFAYALVEALAVTAMWALAPDTAADSRYAGVTLGVLNVGLNVGTLLSAPLSGAVQQQFGWSGVAALFCGVAVVGAILLGAVRLPRAQCWRRTQRER